MKAPNSVTLTDAEIRELEWFRAGVYGLTVTLKLLEAAMSVNALPPRRAFDLAGLLFLVERIESCEVVDNLIDALEAKGGDA